MARARPSLIEAGSGLSSARPSARLFRGWGWLPAALAIVPVVRAWQLTGDLDTALTTVALFAGAAWQFAQLLPIVPERPGPWTRRLALALLGFGLWQLSWVGPNDFWFFRLGFVLWAAVWLAAAWGIAGWIRGWRILAAFGLWAALCDAPRQWSRDADQTGDFLGSQLAVATARVSAWLLWQLGTPVAAKDNLIQLGAHTVSVGVPCTALPLAKLLLLLLALAVLLFRLDLLAAARIAVLTMASSFFISVARVMLLAEVAGVPSRFHYWHDPERGGSGWFTAAGMLVLALLVVRQVFRQRPGPGDPGPVPPAPPPAPDARLIALAAVVVLTIAQLSAIHSFRPVPIPLTSPEFTPVSDSIQWADQDRPAPDEPLWIRRVEYAAPAAPGRWLLVAAFIPRTFSGNPLNHSALVRPLSESKGWVIDAKGEVAASGSATAAMWVTTVAPGEPPVATESGWGRHTQRGFRQPVRWLDWVCHRRALRDNRSYWIGVFETGATRPPELTPPQLLSDWIAVCRQSS